MDKSIVNDYACGCKIRYDRGVVYYIDYCPKHKAAPDMYEALKGFLYNFMQMRKLNPTAFNMLNPNEKKAWIIMRDSAAKAEKALSKAEGKS